VSKTVEILQLQRFKVHAQQLYLMYFLKKENVLERMELCSVPGQSPGPAQIGRWHPPALYGSHRELVMLYAMRMIPKLSTRTPKDMMW